MRRFIAIFFMMIVMTKLSAQSYHAVNFEDRKSTRLNSSH